MSTDTQQVVSKAWNFAHVLRDDGLSYMAYVEQITFLLFLKMADEQTTPPYNRKPIVPAGFDWASLLAKKGNALEAQYRHILETLGTQPGMLVGSSRRRSPKSRTPSPCAADRRSHRAREVDVDAGRCEGRHLRRAAVEERPRARVRRERGGGRKGSEEGKGVISDCLLFFEEGKGVISDCLLFFVAGLQMEK